MSATAWITYLDLSGVVSVQQNCMGIVRRGSWVHLVIVVGMSILRRIVSRWESRVFSVANLMDGQAIDIEAINIIVRAFRGIGRH